jgi:hypothetical protein
MTDLALPGSIERRGPDLDRSIHPLSGIILMGIVAGALPVQPVATITTPDRCGPSLANRVDYKAW